MKTRRILAILLSAAMLLSLMTHAIWAAEEGVTGEIVSEVEKVSEVPELPDIPTAQESETDAPADTPENQEETPAEAPDAEESIAEEAPPVPEDDSESLADEVSDESLPEGSEGIIPEENTDSAQEPDLGEINPMSLLPLETVTATVVLDRTVDFPEKLAKVSPYAFYVEEVLADILAQYSGISTFSENSAPPEEAPPPEVVPEPEDPLDYYSIMYASEQDNFVRVRLNDILTPSESYIYTNSLTKSITAEVHFIVCIGNRGDQFNPNNIRYDITIEYILPDADFFNSLSLVVLNSKGEEIHTSQPYGYFISNAAGKTYDSYCYTSKGCFEKGEFPKALIKLGDKYSAADVEVYSGFVHSEEDIGTKENIASKILYDSEKKEPIEMGHYSFNEDYEGTVTAFLDLTFVVKAADGTKKFLVAQFEVNLADNRVSVSSISGYTSLEYLYKSPDDLTFGNILSSMERYIDRYPVGLYSDFSDFNLKLCAYYYDYIDSSFSGYGSMDLSKIDFACFGEYSSKEAAVQAGAEDIKEKLFSYKASDTVDFSQFDEIKAYLEDGTEVRVKVIQITVSDIYGFVYNVKYYAALSDTLPANPANPSDDTYFKITGALKTDEGSGSSKYLSSYRVRPSDDSYYRYGYQTLFLLDDGQPLEEDVIVPTFDPGTGVDIHINNAFSADNTSSDIQASGVSKVYFKDGEPVQYVAKSQSGDDKSYWVTFQTQYRGGSKLFVNATNDKSRYIDGKPSREIFYNDDFGYLHDILIANVGDQPLTGITAELKNAKGVILDPYWSVPKGSVKTLGAFDTTASPSFDSDGNQLVGELYNLAKIRLLPALVYEDVYGGLYNENGKALYEKVREVSYFGEISGTLVISADGNEKVEIVLTGIAGKPKITTDTLLEGVKYVPYSCMIMTNSMYDTGAMKFSVVDGTLPKGIELLPDGELYGIPMEANEEGCEFTVEARYVGSAPNNTDISGFVDYKTYKLKIADNTDKNVDAVNATQQGYLLMDRVSKYVTVYYSKLNDDGTPVVEKIEIDSNIFRSEGSYTREFKNFYIDGVKLTEGTDYTAVEGSTKITVLAETFSHIGISDNNIAHTLAAEFRTSYGGLLKKSAQNVYIDYLEYKEEQEEQNPQNPENPGGSGQSYPPVQYPPLTANQTTEFFESVSTILTVISPEGSVIPGLDIELHSDVKRASTDDNGEVSFDNVEFGRHTLYIKDNAAGKTASKTFTLVSGFGAELNGDIITAEVGQTIHITVEYDGSSIKIVRAETKVDVPQEGAINEEESEGVNGHELTQAQETNSLPKEPAEEENSMNPGTGLVLGLAPVTALAWILVFIKRR